MRTAGLPEPRWGQMTSQESSVAHQDLGSQNYYANQDQRHPYISCAEQYPPYTHWAASLSQQVRREPGAGQMINGFEGISDQPHKQRMKTPSVDDN